MRIVFFGTAHLACPSLEALAAAGHAVEQVVTQPDRPQGRSLRPTPPPVKETARRLGLPIAQPERAREFVSVVEELAPEVIVVAAYGQILPQRLLDAGRHGAVNVHASLLPKYRGAAPIQWAILGDEPESGVTIMQLDAGLDTGPILSQVRTPILPEDNAQTLHDRLARLGADLLIETLPEYVAGRCVPQPQPAEGASYARKIQREDGAIDWNQPARVLWNRVRAFTPWPGAFAFLPEQQGGKRLKVLEADVAETGDGEPGAVVRAQGEELVVACGRQGLRIRRLQSEGAKPLYAGEFLRGHPLEVGDKLR